MKRETFAVIAGIAIIAVSYGLALYSYGLLLPDMRSDIGLDLATAGIIASAAYLSYLVSTFASLLLTATRGPTPSMLIGGLSATIGMGVLGMAADSLSMALGTVIAGASPGWVNPAVPDFVKRNLHPVHQSSALTRINAGTGIGVMLAGPVALLAGSYWRMAWLAFALLALAATIGVLVMSRSSSDPTRSHQSFILRRELARTGVRPATLVALLLGLSISVYWTYAAELITMNNLNTISKELLWVIIGVSGIAGMHTGSLVRRYGLQRMLQVSTIGQGLAIGMLTLSHLPVVTIVSGVLFGVCFIFMTGLIAIWSVSMFYDRPSVGHGITLLMIGTGQIIGPTVAGRLQGVFSLEAMFLIAMGLMFIASQLRPRQDIHSIVPTANATS